MQVNLAYRGRSAVTWSPAGVAVALAPNLRRDRVSFEGVLRDPLHFREAIGALHDVVVSDLRYRPRDKSTYEAYKSQEKSREDELRRAATKQARVAVHESLPELPESYSAELERRYKRSRTAYWKARQAYSGYLMKHDPELWRLLVPCDPVITVAPDCLFFECFSADESSYGCLTVDRSAFEREHDVALGTTNVDYSWTLYEHFQQMRSYRQTRFLLDPAGFEVRGDADDAYREEKIDLPASWLRGFLQLQSAMSLPMRRVPVGREGLYNILAFLKRHRAAKSPRAIRFELEPGRPPCAVLEPWGQRVRLGDAPYAGIPRGGDPHLGTRPAPGARPAAADPGSGRGLPPGHGAAEFLVDRDGSDPADPRPIRLDDERLVRAAPRSTNWRRRPNPTRPRCRRSPPRSTPIRPCRSIVSQR